MEKFDFATPFSFVNPSMIPVEFSSTSSITSTSRKQFQVDEYGFQTRKAECSKSIESTESTESMEPSHSLCNGRSIEEAKIEYLEDKDKWIKFLEGKFEKFSPDKCQDMNELTFDLNNIDDQTRVVMSQLLECSSIPHDLKAYFWTRLSNSLSFKNQQNWKFQELLGRTKNNSTNNLERKNNSFKFDSLNDVFPTNSCYRTGSEVGIKRWLNCLNVIECVLREDKFFDNKEFIGNNIIDDELNLPLIAGHLLLLCNEEDCCWILLKLASLPIIYNCIELVRRLMDSACPTMAKLIREHEIDLQGLLKEWFTSLFASVICNPHLLFAIWDIFFLEGPIFLVHFTIGLFITQSKILSEELQGLDSSEIIYKISMLPIHAFYIDTCWWTNSGQCLRQLRLIWRSGKNVCKHVKNLSPNMFNYSECYIDRYSRRFYEKHIKQTALLMRLREAIITIKDHFQSYDPEKKYEMEIVLDDNADDKTIEKRDRQNLEDLSRRRIKRAKAIMDFVPESDSDLAFSIGDIIEIHEDEQEHCWLGTIGGKMGLFPPQLVNVLDEREQEYSIAGDDRAVPFLNNIIRGELATVLKEILVIDIRRPKISLTGSFYSTHPWFLLEMVSNSLDDSSEFRDLFSRLVLNRTFNLDRYMTVLKPAEMLYRSVAEINKTHNDSPLDVKFRTLICMGLNQYCLHHWLELLGRSLFCIDYFDEAGIVRTPIWKLVVAELKLLIQFPFHMDPYTEMKLMMKKIDPGLSFSFDNNEISHEEVCDMLVTHHLFSWESR